MLHRAARFLLVLVLLLTAQGQVLARGAMAASSLAAGGDAIVICTGSGTETIVLGPDGSPVAPRHFCPECLPGLASALIPAVAWVPMPSAPSTRFGSPVAAVEVLPASDLLKHLPRGPPAGV